MYPFQRFANSRLYISIFSGVITVASPLILAINDAIVDSYEKFNGKSKHLLVCLTSIKLETILLDTILS